MRTLDWVGRINASGRAYLTPSQLEGRWMVRVSLGVEQSERQHVEALWRRMREAAKAEATEPALVQPIDQ